ncbi:MAG: DUF368 domain-containing protein [Oscillospiraceae bacterium]|nr:DUF368 domain-containing protein [Oscillospiraceae bacterium]
MKKFLYRILCGFFLGLSVFAPGFSGSLVAIAMGIYHELVRIISNPFKKLKENIFYCIPLGVGVLVSAVVFVLAFRQLFDSYEKAVYLLFIGLIAGSIPLVFIEVRKIGFKPIYLIGAAIACAIAVTVSVFASGEGLMSGDTASMADWRGLALGGFAAGITAFIPGMSLSTVLVVLGVYGPLLYAAEALMRMNFSFIVPIGLFILCTVIGLMCTAKGIKYVFDKHPGISNTTVLGFQFGSLIGIAYQSHFLSEENFTWTLGGIMLAAGFCISIMFMVLGRIMNRTESGEEVAVSPEGSSNAISQGDGSSGISDESISGEAD